MVPPIQGWLSVMRDSKGSSSSSRVISIEGRDVSSWMMEWRVVALEL